MFFWLYLNSKAGLLTASFEVIFSYVLWLIQRPCQQIQCYTGSHKDWRFLYSLLDNNLSPTEFFLFSRLRQRAQVGCDRLAEDAHSSTAPGPFRVSCLFYSCIVFLFRTFDIEHSSLSPNVIYSWIHKFHNYTQRVTKNINQEGIL